MQYWYYLKQQTEELNDFSVPPNSAPFENKTAQPQSQRSQAICS